MPNQFDSNRGINGNVPFHFRGTSGGLLVCGATLIFVTCSLYFLLGCLLYLLFLLFWLIYFCNIQCQITLDIPLAVALLCYSLATYYSITSMKWLPPRLAPMVWFLFITFSCLDNSNFYSLYIFTQSRSANWCLLLVLLSLLEQIMWRMVSESCSLLVLSVNLWGISWNCLEKFLV